MRTWGRKEVGETQKKKVDGSTDEPRAHKQSALTIGNSCSWLLGLNTGSGIVHLVIHNGKS